MPVIDRRAMFVVRIAKNLEGKTPAERQEVLSTLAPKDAALVNKATNSMREARRKKLK